MTHPNTDFNAFEEAIQLLTEQGPDAMAETFRILLNHAMQAERSQALAAQPYERTPERKGHANGFKRKFLDARYEKVRQDGAVRSCALLVAIGVCADGKRSILGVSTSLSEAEVHWRNFLLSLKERGLHGVTFVTSDDHEGLRSALKTVFPGAEWQRCQTHLQRNATAYVPKVAMRPAVANDIRDIFNAPSRPEAERRLQLAVKKYEPHASRLALWMEKNIPQGLSVFSLPEAHRKRMRTSNMIERLNKEIKRRTRVVGLFPNEESLLRLVSGVVAEISDDWESGINYLNIKETDSDLPF